MALDEEPAGQMPAVFWTDGLDLLEAKPVTIEVERDDDPNEIALHTYIDGEGSKASYYFDRERAIQLATALLKAVALR